MFDDCLLMVNQVMFERVRHSKRGTSRSRSTIFVCDVRRRVHLLTMAVKLSLW